MAESHTAPRLLLDEHIWEGLASLLRSEGFDVIHVYEIGRGGLGDQDQLEYAAAQGRALLTFNARHFEPLAVEWFFAGRPHAGIIISDELPPGELRRRVENLLKMRSAEELQSVVVWLQMFK